MAELVVIVPSRSRPQAVTELAEAFRETCTAEYSLAFAVDGSDEAWAAYRDAVAAQPERVWLATALESNSMVDALNEASLRVVQASDPPKAIAFMGDDHRPHTKGWDARYLEALEKLPGLVYGNDLLQGANLPTQVAMSASIVRALGHMAPPVLTHLYVDNYWRDLGQAAGCITYLPNVVVEHVHPVAGKADWDAGYRRVNDRGMYDRDSAAYAKYWAENRDRDVQAVRQAVRR